MWKVLGNKYLRPDKTFNNVSEIDLEELKKEGVKGIIFDLDDTLLPSDKKGSRPVIDDWLIRAKDHFSLFVVSNNSRPEYVKTFCEKFHIPYIARAGKPRRKFLNIALMKMNIEKEHVVIIGDRVTTDILAGKRFGIKAYLVTPLTEMPTKIQKFIYKFEAYTLSLIEPKAPVIQEIKKLEEEIEVLSDTKTE